jgi:hypothetical protein
MSLGLAIVFVGMYWRHCLWQLDVEGNWGYVQGTKTIDFLTVPVPAEWRTLEIGELTISIPPSLLEDSRKTDNRHSGAGRIFRISGAGRSIVVIPPTDFQAVQREMEAELRSLGEATFSYARTMAEVYSADSGDFRWSMSNAELAKHIWLIRQARFARVSQTRSVELALGGEFEGILLWRDGVTVFEWCCPSHVTSGSLVFRSDKPGDYTWVKQVCSSLRHTGSPEQRTKPPKAETENPEWEFRARVTECRVIDVDAAMRPGVAYTTTAIKETQESATLVVGVDSHWLVTLVILDPGNDPLDFKRVKTLKLIIHSPTRSLGTDKPENRDFDLALSYQINARSLCNFTHLRVNDRKAAK